MKFCFDCNKVIFVDNILDHINHRIGEQTFKQMYDEAMTKVRE